MSGPYPPPGYPRPPRPGDGWHDPRYGQQPPQYDFPTVQYSGLATPPGGWGEPPRRPRNRARLIVAVISVLVIIGGVATAAVLLNHRHTQQNAAPPPAAATHATAPTTSTATAVTSDVDPGMPNGSTTLTLHKGACVTAQAVADNQYRLGRQVMCGTAQSDLVLAVISPVLTGCPDHQFLRVSGPSTGVYCFTLDVRKGDCLDSSFLKAPCAAGAFAVLSVEAGPGRDSSCGSVNGATHWVPIGHDPVTVACIGPAKTS